MQQVLAPIYCNILLNKQIYPHEAYQVNRLIYHFYSLNSPPSIWNSVSCPLVDLYVPITSIFMYQLPLYLIPVRSSSPPWGRPVLCVSSTIGPTFYARRDCVRNNIVVCPNRGNNDIWKWTEPITSHLFRPRPLAQTNESDLFPRTRKRTKNEQWPPTLHHCPTSPLPSHICISLTATISTSEIR